MRTPSKNIYELISSLSRKEKHYFKRQRGIFFSDKKIYLKLFDAIDRYGYDEKTIQRLLRINKLSQIKNYLYNSIIKCLKHYYKDLSLNAKLADMLQSIEVLYKKALFDQCKELLEKAKRLAKKENKHLMLLQLLEIENTITRSYYFKNFAGGYKKIQDQQQSALNEYINITHFNMLITRLLLFIEINGEHIRSREAYDEISEMANSPILKDETKAITNRSRNLFYNLNVVLGLILGDYEKACYYSKKRIGLLEAIGRQNDNDLRNYVHELSNLTIAETMGEKYQDAQRTINKIKNIKSISNLDEVMIFQVVALNQLNLLIHTGEYKKINIFLPEIESKLKIHKNKLYAHYEMNIYDNISKLFFIHGDYKKALLWINPLVTEDRLNIKPDLQCLTRVFYLVIHYELGNFEMLYNLSMSTIRFIRKMKRLYKFEQIILSFMKKISLISPPDHIKMFKELAQQLRLLKEDPYEKKVFEDFDYLIWAESKVNGNSYAQLIQKKQTTQ